MIHRLRGQLVEKDMEGVVVDVGGVGYRASASANTLRALPSLGEECVLHTRMVVREDAMQLFGFAGREERAAFDSLTAVSKVGPKLALAILSNLAAFDPGISGGNAGGPFVEAREALAALGYSLDEAERALKEVPPQDSVQTYVKEALRRMGGTRR